MGTDLSARWSFRCWVPRHARDAEESRIGLSPPLAPRSRRRNDPAGPRLGEQNEAEILGLRDEWAERHVRTCLARQPLKKR
jgi:hypothetical protein